MTNRKLFAAILIIFFLAISSIIIGYARKGIMETKFPGPSIIQDGYFRLCELNQGDKRYVFLQVKTGNNSLIFFKIWEGSYD